MRIIMEPLREDTSAEEEMEVIREEWVSRTLARVHEQKQLADERLRAVLGPGRAIDEMAVMFSSAEAVSHWVSAAVRLPGVTLFNSARDVVQTRPIPSTYDVHYWFLTAPDLPDGPQTWRIEAMHAHPGSPLHDAILRKANGAETTVVHASFKCADEEDYAVAVSSLRGAGFEASQLCESTYGRFSYWAPGEGPQTGVYLKPRVNLRDTTPEADSE